MRRPTQRTGGGVGGPARLAPQAAEVVDRNTTLGFTFDGKPFPALAGDTVVSALAAAGLRTLSRSFKYHRRRGVFSADLHDPNCFMTIDARPNCPAAHVQVREGMTVTSQNAWPSLDHDVKAANQLVERFLSTGFYYKTFMAPAALRDQYQKVLQRFSPGGVLGRDVSADYYDKRFIFHDVVVAGAGPAGLSAALGAAEAGASVLLVEEEHELGGHLRWGSAAELRVLADLRKRLDAQPSIDVLLDSTVFGRYDGNWIGVHERQPSGPATERLHKGRPRCLVVATGLLERPYVFSGNDLPGVMLASAAQRLVALYGVQPGRRAVVLSAGDQGDGARETLAAAGIEVSQLDVATVGLQRAMGRRAVEAVELVGGRRIQTDLLVMATGWTAQTSLLSMAGVPPTFDESAGRFVATNSDRTDVLAVGGLVGDGSIDDLVEHGHGIGRLAAHGRSVPKDFTPGLSPAPHPLLVAADDAAQQRFAFVDFSEDVTAHDIGAAVEEGYASIELAKRYTTATMGPTQGSYSMVNTVALHAQATGLDVHTTGTPTWRPPYTPVTLGALAGRRFNPVRRTPMHQWHEQSGATLMYAGQWLRPQHYGDPAAEAAAVRRSVGIIDVSTLGKFELVGADVPRLLEWLYVNRWSNLKVGSVRYGLMCNEEGVALDDGVAGRLSDSRYVMSATSSGAGRVDEWIREWLLTSGADADVAVTDVTDAFASMNVAGPRSRDVLAPLVDGPSLAADGLGYMKVAEATVAGVPGCFIWRIGFTGELAYEVYVPAGRGLQVWEAIVAAGRPFDIRPFGVEAQRTLRIEKGHPVVGQDTDALTGPYAIGLAGLVKIDKPDMAGWPELAWRAEHPESVPMVLVGLQPEGAVVPPEASLVVAEGRAIGRVTSSCWSPALRRPICLALVERSHAVDGGTVDLSLARGGTVAAQVRTTTAHVDPEGARLRG